MSNETPVKSVAPSSTPQPVTAPAKQATPAAPAKPRDPYDLGLSALLARVSELPGEQRGQARDALLQLRGFRLLVVGPPGGGKTTAVLSMGRLGKIGVVALDRDMKPSAGVRIWRMPEPEVFQDIPRLKTAHTEAINEMRALRGTPDECRVYVLDTVSSIYSMVEGFAMENDGTGMMGLTTNDTKGMRDSKNVANVAMGWCKSIWRLCAGSCEVSKCDGPLVFAVTEHCRPLTKGEANPRTDKNGNAVVDLAFHSWVPMIGRATGNKIEGGPDWILGFSTMDGAHGPFSLRSDLTGAHTKHRFTPQELEIASAIMTGKRMDRLAVALQAIYLRRKALWLRTWFNVSVPGLGDKDDTVSRWAPSDWSPEK